MQNLKLEIIDNRRIETFQKFRNLVLQKVVEHELDIKENKRLHKKVDDRWKINTVQALRYGNLDRPTLDILYKRQQ